MCGAACTASPTCQAGTAKPNSCTQRFSVTFLNRGQDSDCKKRRITQTYRTVARAHESQNVTVVIKNRESLLNIGSVGGPKSALKHSSDCYYYCYYCYCYYYFTTTTTTTTTPATTTTTTATPTTTATATPTPTATAAIACNSRHAHLPLQHWPKLFEKTPRWLLRQSTRRMPIRVWQM